MCSLRLEEHVSRCELLSPFHPFSTRRRDSCKPGDRRQAPRFKSPSKCISATSCWHRFSEGRRGKAEIPLDNGEGR